MRWRNSWLRPAVIICATAALAAWAGCTGGPDIESAPSEALAAPRAGELLFDRVVSSYPPTLTADRWQLPPTTRHPSLARALRGSAPR